MDNNIETTIKRIVTYFFRWYDADMPLDDVSKSEKQKNEHTAKLLLSAYLRKEMLLKKTIKLSTEFHVDKRLDEILEQCNLQTFRSLRPRFIIDTTYPYDQAFALVLHSGRRRPITINE